MTDKIMDTWLKNKKFVFWLSKFQVNIAIAGGNVSFSKLENMSGLDLLYTIFANQIAIPIIPKDHLIPKKTDPWKDMKYENTF